MEKIAKGIIKELKSIRRELEKINKQAVSMGKTTCLTVAEIKDALDGLGGIDNEKH